MKQNHPILLLASLALAVVLGGMLPMSSAAATTITVTSLADGAPDFDDGQLTLREAILMAEAGSEPATIVFAPELIADGPGVIQLSVFEPGLDGGDRTAATSQAGPTAFIISGMITIEGPSVPNGLGLEIQRPSNAPAYRLFHVHQSASLTLRNLTLRGGFARGGRGTAGGGGAAGMGGGIFNVGTLHVEQCTLIGNRAEGGSSQSWNEGTPGTGGGMGADGAATAGGGPNGGTLSDAFGGFGGFGGGGSYDGPGGFGGGGGFNGTTGLRGGFGGGGGGATSNTASGFGGGVSIAGIPAGGLGSGGAIFNYPGGSVSILRSLLRSNHCEGGGPSSGGGAYGGAVFNYAGTLSIVDSTVTQNSCLGRLGARPFWAAAGGVFNLNGAVTIEACTFTSNSVSIPGGGVTLDGNAIFNYGASGDAVRSNVVPGPGIATLTMSNTIIASHAGLQLLCSSEGGSSVTSGSGNLVQSQSGFNGGIVTSANPQLGALADNGGFTLTYGLVPTSPAYGAGNMAATTSTTDQRGAGFPRVVDGRVDIGAFQFSVRVHYVNPGATNGAGDGRSWADAFTELRTAFVNASSFDEIWVARGTHTPGQARTDTFTLKANVGCYGGFSGNETAREQRNSNPLTNDTVLSGSAVDNYHVVTGTGANSLAVLDGFTITGGHADGAIVDRHHVGGGITVDGSGSPTLRNLDVTGNTAVAGGGIYANLAAPAILSSRFTGNTATDGGGGLYLNDSAGSILINLLIANNTAANRGGGLFTSSGTLTATNLTLTGNDAPTESAIRINSGAIVLRNSIVWNNTGATQEIGGPGSATLTNTLTGADPVLDVNFVPQADSPAIDTGANSFNAEPSDLMLNPRIVNGLIDLGAFESPFVTFAGQFPGLDPNGDANGNGRSNYHDYAAGFDPTVSVSDGPMLLLQNGDFIFQSTVRINARDVLTGIEGSENLVSWDPLEPGTEIQNILEILQTPARLQIHERLLFPDPAPERYFLRRVFSAALSP